MYAPVFLLFILTGREGREEEGEGKDSNYS